MEKERQHILNDNLRVLLFRFSYPAIIGLVAAALYNMVDTIFVGRGVGPIAIAALTIVLPLQIIMWAIGFMIGVGSASIISRSLGAGKKDTALNIAGNAILLNLLLNILFMIPAFIFIDKILMFFGASREVLPYSRQYAVIILMGFIFYSFPVFANIIIRAEGKPRAAMYPVIVGAVLNMILDPIYVFVFKMGVKGVAIATIISQAVSTVFIIIYFFKGKSIYRFKFSNFKLEWALIIEILKIGTPSFLMATMDSVIFLLFNRAIIQYGNDLYIAIVGIGIRVIDLTIMPIIGITQGLATIVGFNYGARLYSRVKKVLGEAIIWNTVIAGLAFVILMFFPRFLLGFFSDDKELIKNGILPLRIIVALFPALGFQIIGSSFFQAIGKPLPAAVITISRQVIFLIPAIFILPLFFGLNGIFLSWPFSDFMDLIVTSIFVVREIKIINRAIKTQAFEYSPEQAG
jgi:putative MATE family efflux protein